MLTAQQVVGSGFHRFVQDGPSLASSLASLTPRKGSKEVMDRRTFLRMSHTRPAKSGEDRTTPGLFEAQEVEMYALDEDRFLSCDENGILIHVKVTTVCGSENRNIEVDPEAARVPPGLATGHEFSGDVFALGKRVTNFELGQRITGVADMPCEDMECVFCHPPDDGPPRRVFLCRNGNPALGHKPYHGSYQEFMYIPGHLVEHGGFVTADESISYEHLMLVEPLACLYHGMAVGENPDWLKGRSVALIGSGSQGAMGVKLARALDARQVHLVSHSKARYDVAGKFEPDFHYLWQGKRVPELAGEIRANTLGKLGVDLVLTCCAGRDAVMLGQMIICPGGINNAYAGIGHAHKHDDMIPISQGAVHYDELGFIGTHGADRNHAEAVVALLKAGKIKGLDLLFDDRYRYDLDDLGKALQAKLDRRDCYKPRIYPRALQEKIRSKRTLTF